MAACHLHSAVSNRFPPVITCCAVHYSLSSSQNAIFLLEDNFPVLRKLVVTTQEFYSGKWKVVQLEEYAEEYTEQPTHKHRWTHVVSNTHWMAGDLPVNQEHVDSCQC